MVKENGVNEFILDESDEVDWCHREVLVPMARLSSLSADRFAEIVGDGTHLVALLRDRDGSGMLIHNWPTSNLVYEIQLSKKEVLMAHKRLESVSRDNPRWRLGWIEVGGDLKLAAVPKPSIGKTHTY